MKNIYVTVLAIVFAGLACEPEEGDQGFLDQEQQQVSDGGAALECEAPNMAFDGRCCSPQGTWGGNCKYNRYWISTGNCNAEFVVEGIQYCCGGMNRFGAYGFQCLEE